MFYNKKQKHPSRIFLFFFQNMIPRKLKSFIQTYPPTVAYHAQKIKKRNVFGLEQHISNYLSERLGKIKYQTKLMRLNVILIDPTQIRTSKMLPIEVHFDENPNWHKELCKTFQLSELFVYSNNLCQVDVKNMKRVDFAISNILYGVVSKEAMENNTTLKKCFDPSISTQEIVEYLIPRHHHSNKHEHYTDWFVRLLKETMIQLCTHLYKMEAQEFQNFVRTKKAGPFLRESLSALLRDKNILKSMGHDVETFEDVLKKYLHISEKKDLEKFQTMIEVYVCQPIQYLLCACKKVLNQYIQATHAEKYTKHRGGINSSFDPSLTQEEFKFFWIKIFGKYILEFGKYVISDQLFLEIMHAPQMNCLDVLCRQRGALVQLCSFIQGGNLSFLINNQQMMDHSNYFGVQDKYADYYDDIHPPWYYVWIISSTSSPTVNLKPQQQQHQQQTVVTKNNGGGGVNVPQQYQNHVKSITNQTILKHFEKDPTFTLLCRECTTQMYNNTLSLFPTVSQDASMVEFLDVLTTHLSKKGKEDITIATTTTTTTPVVKEDEEEEEDEDEDEEEDEETPKLQPISPPTLKYGGNNSVVLIKKDKSIMEFPLNSLRLVPDDHSGVPFYRFVDSDSQVSILISPITNVWSIGTESGNPTKNGGNTTTTATTYRTQHTYLGERRVDKTILLYEL